MANRDDLGAFLRRRRASLTPAEVGLPTGTRRRTPGLRREEVAGLAAMSFTYYERLEQGRGPNPSPSVLAAVAAALRLDRQECEYLYSLAGHAVPVTPTPAGYVDQVLHAAMAAMQPTACAVITDHLGTVVAQNQLSVELIGTVVGAPDREDNLIWRWFTQPDWRARCGLEQDDEEWSRSIAAYLRGATARFAPDPTGVELIVALRAASDEFAQLWSNPDVTAVYCSMNAVSHLRTGPITLECGVVLSPLSSHRLMLLQPAPGESAERLAALVR
ncbi:helix-turn-helix transcriptional regulator [Streptomyces sp. NPDC101175]|uniref:helix-turn-helix transcriptional regulator n=1 Tax=Streptomyces sp. NPDC101175 TaxID=3366123 RepID=UPI0038390AD7